MVIPGILHSSLQKAPAQVPIPVKAQVVSQAPVKAQATHLHHQVQAVNQVPNHLHHQVQAVNQAQAPVRHQV